jgi:GAF domain-containing protein
MNISNSISSISIRTKLILLFLIIAIFCVGSLSLATYYIVQSNFQTQAGITFTSIARSQALIIGTELSKQVDLLYTLAHNRNVENAVIKNNNNYQGTESDIRSAIIALNNQWINAVLSNNKSDPLVRSVTSNSIVEEFDTFIQQDNNNQAIIVTDVYGALVASTDRIPSYNQANTNWWKASYANGAGAVFFETPTYDEINKAFAINIAIPIYLNENSANKVIGILRTTYNISALTAFLNQVQIGETGSADLIFPNGEVLKSTGGRAIFNRSLLTQLNNISGSYGVLEYNNEMRFVSQVLLESVDPQEADPISKLGWVLVISQNQAETLQALSSVVRTILIISIFSFLLATVLSIISAQIISGPLVRLTHSISQVGEGVTNYRIPVESGDEIGVLAKLFNNLLSKLSDLISSLEKRVVERTESLERRTLQMKTAVEVGSAAISLRNTDDLLDQATRLISSGFRFSHVGIFLVDDNHEYAVLRASNSAGGQAMLLRGHKLKIGETGIVGYVTKHGIARIALNVGEDATFFNNPDLPNTRSEMALPLIIGGRIIGALDIQSNIEAAFTDDDITTMQVLANQLAASLDNARLFSENVSALESVRKAYTEERRSGWNKLLKEKDNYGYLLKDQDLLTPAIADWNKNLHKSISTDSLVVNRDRSEICLPVKVHSQIIGAIRLRKSGNSGLWDDDEIKIIKNFSDQLSSALDSARLYGEINRKAILEQTITEMTTQIAASPETDSILKTTAEILGKLLGDSRVTVKIQSEHETTESSNN